MAEKLTPDERLAALKRDIASDPLIAAFTRAIASDPRMAISSLDRPGTATIVDEHFLAAIRAAVAEERAVLTGVVAAFDNPSWDGKSGVAREILKAIEAVVAAPTTLDRPARDR